MTESPLSQPWISVGDVSTRPVTLGSSLQQLQLQCMFVVWHEFNDRSHQTKVDFYSRPLMLSDISAVQYVCMYCRRCADCFVPYFSKRHQNMVQTILFVMD